MSIEAVKWALSIAPLKPSQSAARDRLVLVALADRHNYAKNGEHVVWASISTISTDCQQSVSSVKRALQSLEEQEVIHRGLPGLPAEDERQIVAQVALQRRFVPHITADRRPVVWVLDLSQGATNEGSTLTPRENNDSSTLTPREGSTLIERGFNVDLQTIRTTTGTRERGDIIEETSPAQPLADSLYESFPDHCRRHRHAPPEDVGPCGGCRAQREANEQRATQSKDERTAQEARRIAGIPHCDYCTDDGTHPYIKRSSTGGLFEHVKNCDHSEQDRHELDEVETFQERQGDTAA